MERRQPPPSPSGGAGAVLLSLWREWMDASEGLDIEVVFEFVWSAPDYLRDYGIVLGEINGNFPTSDLHLE